MIYMDTTTRDSQMDQFLAQHFTMFDFSGVIVHLFVDAFVDGAEEGRIVVKSEGVTVMREEYRGELHKSKKMCMALECAAEFLYDMQKEIK